MSLEQLSKTLPEILRKPSNALSAATSSTTLSGSEAARAATVLLGCFRKGDAADPETYVKGITAIFSEYDEVIVRKVVDPRTGLPSKAKFLPTISEVKEECERFMAPRHAAARNEAARLEDAKRLQTPTADPEELAAIAAEKARVSSRYGSFVEEVSEKAEALRIKDSPDSGKDAQRARMAENDRILRDREWRSIGVSTPPKISLALANNLGIAPKQPMQEAAE